MTLSRTRVVEVFHDLVGHVTVEHRGMFVDGCPQCEEFFDDLEAAVLLGAMAPAARGAEPRPS